MRRVVYAASVVLLMIGEVSCSKGEKPKENVPIVDVVAVKGLGDMSATTFTGKTKAVSEVNLAFRVSGTIQQVLVREGDVVRKGQVVAVMDGRDYEVQLAATQAEYEQVKVDAERVMALYAEGNTTASNNDKARYGLQQITQKLANHRNQLADTRLRSPLDGYVQSNLHEAGETVSAGMPILSVFGGGDTEVEIHLSAEDFARLGQFRSFYCKFDVTGQEAFPLSIVRTSQEANASQLYQVRLKFDEKINGKHITPGMTAMVYAEVENRGTDGVVSVPSSAVFRSDGEVQVFIYDAESGTVQSRPVHVSAVHRDGTASIDSGLQVGDSVISSGVHHVKSGQKVKRLQPPSTSNVGGLL